MSSNKALWVFLGLFNLTVVIVCLSLGMSVMRDWDTGSYLLGLAIMVIPTTISGGLSGFILWKENSQAPRQYPYPPAQYRPMLLPPDAQYQQFYAPNSIYSQQPAQWR